MEGAFTNPEEITQSGEKQMAIDLFRRLAYFNLKKREINGILRIKYKLKFHVLDQALFHLQRAEECLDKFPIAASPGCKGCSERSEARLQRIVPNNPHFTAQNFNSL